MVTDAWRRILRARHVEPRQVKEGVEATLAMQHEEKLYVVRAFVESIDMTNDGSLKMQRVTLLVRAGQTQTFDLKEERDE
jgi:hypothetical protein